MGPQPGPRVVKYRLGWGFPVAPVGEPTLPVGTPQTNLFSFGECLTFPSFSLPASRTPSVPSLTCQLQVPGPPPSLRLCPLQERPLGSALATCCQGDGGPTQEQVHPSSPSLPGHGKQSPEKTEKRYPG